MNDKKIQPLTKLQVEEKLKYERDKNKLASGLLLATLLMVFVLFGSMSIQAAKYDDLIDKKNEHIESLQQINDELSQQLSSQE